MILKKFKRFLALSLVLAMILSLIPAVSAAGSYEKATSIAVGDTVLLVYEADSMELSAIGGTSTKYGIGVAYTGSPAGVAPLEVVAGASEGTYAFKMGEAYLCWTSGNSLKTADKVDASASWNVSFDDAGNAVITNAGTPERSLQWNAGSPRFACYTSTQKAIQLYKLTSGSGGGSVDPTDPAPTDPAPTDPAPTDPAPTDPEPTTPPVVDDGLPKVVIAALVGDTYYAMSNTFAAKISGTPIAVNEDREVAGADAGAYAVSFAQVSGGYTISYQGTYLTYKSSTSFGTSDQPYVWKLSAGVNGSSRLTPSGAETRGLVFRAGTYNQFGAYALSNCEAGSTEYFDVELLSVQGEVPIIPPTTTEPPQPTCYKPKASPEAGAVVKGTEVTLSCSTKDSIVLYHLGDGNWTQYTAPIVIDRAMTITAKGQAPDKADSDEVTFSYTVYEVGEMEAILVTDASQLASGDQFIIVARDYTASMGNQQGAKNRNLGNVIKTGNTCRYDENTQVLTLESGATEGTYALYTGQGYLYAPTDDGNYLRTQDDKTDIGSFFITIAADGTATITADTTKAANTIMYNNSNKIYSCYKSTSSQKPVVIYKLANQERPGMPENGDTVVLYNLAARGAVSVAEAGSLKTVGATLSKGYADGANGTLLFKVEKNEEVYRFYNETFGYLTAKGAVLSYSETATEYADWTIEAYNGGYKLLSAESKVLLGQTGSVKLGSQIGDKDTATYHFYPCNSDSVMEGVVNKPFISFGNPSPAYAGQNYILNFTVDAVFGAKDVEVTVSGTKLEVGQSYGRYSVTVPADMISGTALEVSVKATDNKGIAMEASVSISVKDEPMISDTKPVSNSQTKEEKRPEISAKVANAGANPTISMTVNGQEVTATYADDRVTYKPATDLADGRTVVILTVTREDGKSVTKKWNFTVGESAFTMVFGQLHSHTGEYSDGAGTLAGALEYIESLPADANVDFVAFTDHSNYFDTSAAPNVEDALYDLSLATPESAEKWTTYKSVMADFNNSHAGQVLAIPGFEMTWSGGPGHINTFVTEGIVSRNNTTLNNKSADAGMRAYYELIAREEGEDSISQLNHPGTTFGNFTDFAYWTPEADAHVYLVEVGNGEGALGSAGYFPSYEEYTLALDKGWHVAPTNNQDNHKGKWGNANEARDVILVEEFTEEAIYDAIRNYRVYATEDRNLEITYTVNDLPMGTLMENVPEKLNFSITLKDPDASDKITSVELIVNSGKIAYSWTAEEIATGVLTAELDPDYTYYYVRVVQSDKDIAVTAPVWVGENLRLGIKDATMDADIPVVGEELNINTVFNNEEKADAIVKNIVYTMDGSQVIYVDNQIHLLSAGSEVTIPFAFTPEVAKLTTITVTATVEYDSKEFTFSKTVELNVVKAEEIGYMAIDASHANEYVAGHYSQMMANFTTMAQDANIRTTVIKNSKDLIAACENEKMDAIVLNVPSRRAGSDKAYTAEELAALKAFNARGGILIISNQADTYDAEPHMAATMNAVLESVGSSLRFMDDAVKDGTYNGVYASAFGNDPLTKGLSDSVYFYNGSSVYAVDAQGKTLSTLPATVSPVLFGNSNTASVDGDNDGKGGTAVKYAYTTASGATYSRILLMAAERAEGKGMVFVSGVPFMNDYNVTEPAQYGNNALAQNLLNAVNPIVISTIAEVRAQTEVGYKYTIEGTVTSNASGYDKDTAFFDCIYIQDETAGICCFPVAGEYKVGDVVRIQGLTEFYIGEPELQVTTIEKIGETEPFAPMVITASQLNDRSVEGNLITLKGYVVNYTMANGLVESIYVIDEEGVIGRAFIDGYITADNEVKDLEIGKAITVTGIASYDNTYAIEHDSYSRIRVRDRADIVTSEHTHTLVTVPAVAPTCTETGLTEGQACSVCTVVTVPQEIIPATGHTMAGDTCTVCGYVEPKEEPMPFTDVAENAWYYDAVEYVYNHKLMNGTKTDVFAPERTLTRAMLVTILYRMAGEPEVTIDNPFADVPAGQWYTEAVLWGYENNIVKGLKADKFGPDSDVTREQMVTFLYRYAAYAGYDMTVKADLSAYQDADTVSGYAVDAFAWAIGRGIVNGVTKDTLKPLGTATRAQVAKVIMALDSWKK